VEGRKADKERGAGRWREGWKVIRGNLLQGLRGIDALV